MLQTDWLNDENNYFKTDRRTNGHTQPLKFDEMRTQLWAKQEPPDTQSKLLNCHMFWIYFIFKKIDGIEVNAYYLSNNHH